MRFVIKKSKDNQYYVNIVAKNGKILMTSEMYRKKSSAKKMIKTVGSGVLFHILDQVVEKLCEEGEMFPRYEDFMLKWGQVSIEDKTGESD